jgi:sacsin
MQGPNLRPYLHGVPSELSSHAGLLAALGVRRAFAAEDFARAAARLATDAAGSPLPEERVALAVAFAEAGPNATPLFSFSAQSELLVLSWSS